MILFLLYLGSKGAETKTEARNFMLKVSFSDFDETLKKLEEGAASVK